MFASVFWERATGHHQGILLQTGNENNGNREMNMDEGDGGGRSHNLQELKLCAIWDILANSGAHTKNARGKAKSKHTLCCTKGINHGRSHIAYTYMQRTPILAR
jgi:hypothetical protein